MAIFKKIFGSNKLPFGLDIGYTSVRAVQLEEKNKLVHLSSYGEAPVKDGVFSGSNINTDELAFAIKHVISQSERGSINSKQVVCALPESDTFVKNIQLPKMEDDELEEVVRFELEKIVPIPIEDLFIDWRKTKEGSEKEKDNIIVVAASKKMVNSYVEALNKASLEILALDVEPAAVSRALIKRDGKQNNDAYLIIDMGADTTTVTIHDFGSIQLTGSTRVAGNDITKNLAKKLNIGNDKAEEIKRHVINSGRKLKPKLFEETVKPVLDQLSKEVERSIKYYTTYIKSPHKIKGILLSGGNARLVGIADFFEEKFKIKTDIGNPWSNVTAYPLKAIPKLKASLYTTAIGLALRELMEE